MTAARASLWLALALPGLTICARWAMSPDEYGYGHAVGDSGLWAAWLLLLTLAVAPIRLLFGARRWTAWLARRRRDLGVASFVYAAGHTVVYLAEKASLATVLADARDAAYLAGWLALALFAPLAATSTDRAMRALGRGWKRLHRLVYPAAILAFAHWALAAFDPTTAYAHIALLAAILLLGSWLRRRQRVT